MAADELTEKEAEALTYVGDGYTSKEIAARLGISPASVDQRIDGARRKLGNVSRTEAARRFAALEGAPERLPYEPFRVTPDNEYLSSPSTPQDQLRLNDAMFDERAAWDRGTMWRRPHLVPADLGKVSRVLAILVIALLSMLVLSEGADVAASFGRLFPA